MSVLRLPAVLKTALSISILFLFSNLANAQKPGAYLWADSDGNGIIEVPDKITLNSILGGSGTDDSYIGHPQSRFRQELDGNGIIEVPDLIILNSWLGGNFTNQPGTPDQLLLDGDTNVDLKLGDSVTLSAYALSPDAAGGKIRTGFGVIFKIDPSSTCVFWGQTLNIKLRFLILNIFEIRCWIPDQVGNDNFQ